MSMQSSFSSSEAHHSSLGHRRGVSDLARFALDLTGQRARPAFAACSTDYPSPPMSGSPPLGHKADQGLSTPNQSGYRTAQDVRGTSSTARSDASLQGTVTASSIPYIADPQDRIPYVFRRSDDARSRPLSYPPLQGQAPPQHPYLPVLGPGTAAPSYPLSSRPQRLEIQPFASPPSHRRTKGHVASACVPCKRAHLRCDAQRPCSRCLSNGKEESCVDVQHKKRGRPRLRDEGKFDPSRFGQQPEASIRRPLSLYVPPSPTHPSHDDSLHRTQSYRVLKSHASEAPLGPRFMERGSTSDANFFHAPFSMAPRLAEPAACLNMEGDIVNASDAFANAVGRGSVKGLKLIDIVAANDRDRFAVLQRQMREEQGRKDPNYLPPIFEKKEEDRVTQALSFSPEELSRFALDRHEYLTFIGQDGQQRALPIQMGLAKQESIYFVVVLLTLRQLGPAAPIRELPYGYQTTQRPFSQPAPGTSSYDPLRRFSMDPGPSMGHAGLSMQMTQGMSPSMPPSYAAPAIRSDYHGITTPYSMSRDEPSPGMHRAQLPGVQLPPIRSQQPEQASPGPGWPRKDRHRVDISGLVDRSEPPSHHRR